MIGLPAGTRIWLAAGVTDMRSGFNGLASKVQTALQEDPYSGHVFAFRGRRSDLIKVLWWTGDGLCLLCERLERCASEIEHLVLAKLRRTQFGRSSEKLDQQIEQLELQLEDLEADEAVAEAEAPAEVAPRKKAERKPLPQHLPREERVHMPVRDDRASGGTTPPAVWLAYSPDRKGEHPQAHLANFNGVLQADAYAGFNAVYETGGVIEAACWHMHGANFMTCMRYVRHR